MTHRLVLGCWVLLAALAAHVAIAAADDLAYVRTYPELATGGRPAVLTAAARQPDGKVVLAGYAYQPTNGDTDWVAARIEPATGALDATFGTGGVVQVPINLIAGGTDMAFDVGIGPAGRIVMVGDAQTASGSDMAAVALTAAGERDAGFGPQGLRTFAFGNFDRASAVLVAPDGTVVAVGGRAGQQGADPFGFGLVQVDAAGEPVPGFGTDGKVRTPLGGTDGDELRTLLRDPQGRLVGVGTADAGFEQSDLALVRYSETGAADPVRVVSGQGRDFASDAVLHGGSIVVGADNVSQSFALSTYVQAFDPEGFGSVAGFGGPTFGTPSLFGGLAQGPGGQLFALGVGPFGGGVHDDWKLAPLVDGAPPSGSVRNHPGTADRSERAAALLFDDDRALLVGTQGPPDVPAVAAVDIGAAPTGCGLVAPGDVTTTNDPGRDGGVVNYAPPVTSGNCGPVTCVPASGSFFPVGTTTVTCSTTDASGFPIRTTFTVTVRDSEPPRFTEPPRGEFAFVTTSNGSRTLSYTPPVAVDNVPGVKVACVPPPGTRFPRGRTKVTCTATDLAGNTATTTFDVEVIYAISINGGPAVSLETSDFTVPLNAPGPGSATVTGTANSAALGSSARAARRVVVAKARKRIRRAGRVRVRLKASRRAMRVVRRKGRLPIRVKVVFRPRGGGPSSTDTARIVLKLKRRG